MRATDIVRQVLDLLDEIEGQHDLQEPTIEISNDEEAEPVASRFKQIFAMLDNSHQPALANSPNEVVADVDSVTTDAGGGVNGPKHVDDIRTAHPRQYGNN